MKWLGALPVALVLSGCLLERVGQIDRTLKPYGAHWIKSPMTREDRRADSWACGAADTVYAADHVVFTLQQRQQARLPSDKNDFGPDGRLLDQWRACMQSRGYVYLKTCDERCMHP